MCSKGLDFKGFLFKRIQDHVLKDPGSCLNLDLYFKGSGTVFKRIWDSCLTQDLFFKGSGLVSPRSHGIPSGIRDDLCPLRAAESSIHLPPPPPLCFHLSTGNRQLPTAPNPQDRCPGDPTPRDLCSAGRGIKPHKFCIRGLENPNLGLINEGKNLGDHYGGREGAAPGMRRDLSIPKVSVGIRVTYWELGLMSSLTAALIESGLSSSS